MMDEATERGALEAITILAKMARCFYGELILQGFSPFDALRLTMTWVEGQARGGGSK
jgi:hypothetical protein